MGRWFPAWRPATREQVQAYREAHQKLFRNTRYESAAGVRTETERSADLNDRAFDSGAPLSRTQQSWHWRKALNAEDRDFYRMQRAADRQSRARKRESKPQRKRGRGR